jgi:hypothetical protein
VLQGSSLAMIYSFIPKKGAGVGVTMESNSGYVLIRRLGYKLK